jgi:hypothetical protein
MKPSALVPSILLAASLAAIAADDATPLNLSPAGPTLAQLNAAKDWTPIFDGKSLSGWTGSGYEVQDGAIVCTPSGAFLRTEKEYGDFVLDFEFKLKPGSNNGIGLRYPGEGDAAYVGMEIQVLDDRHEKYKGLAPYQYHGSVYGTARSLQSEKNLLKPAGEWNREQIICVGDHVKVILNGETITETYLTGIKPIDGNPHPGLARTSGYIAFCGHGDYVAYRSLRILDFKPAAHVLPGNPDNTPPPGFSALFNGKDLSGWKGLLKGPNDKPHVRATLSPDKLAAEQKIADEIMNANWKIEDGALVFSGKGESLATAKAYGDFEFFVDWKIPANADSGIYLRGAPQVQIWDPANPSQFQHGNQKGSGGLWNNKAEGKDPLVKADKPIGEWNTFHIRMIGERATIWLNGQLVVNNARLEYLWDAKVPLPRAEQIELQNHGNNLWFKNIYLREIPY